MKNSINIKQINKQGVSIIIGARNEFPQIAMTIGNLMEDCLSNGIKKFEFILMDNGSEDETSRFFAWKLSQKIPRQKYIYSPRGLVAEKRLRIFYDPVLSNVGTRNKGVLHARYENIIFADAHITVKHGTVKYALDALNRYGGIIHAPVSWMGSDGADPKPSFQYSYKVGEKIWGTWNKLRIADEPFYIALSGHCFLAVKRKEFLEKKGYPYAQRVYGGGEPYLDTKWWMTGSTSMCDPRGTVYHLSAGRGYSWNGLDLINNMLLVSYILGGQKWCDRILITYLNKPGTQPDLLKMMQREAIAEGEEDKKWLDKNRIMTFEEMLSLQKKDDCDKCMKRGRPEPHAMRIWDKMNDKLHGTHRSYVVEFELTRTKEGVFIGRTPIIAPVALEIASQYV